MIELNGTTISMILGVVASVLGIFSQLHQLKKANEDMVRKQAEQQTKLETRLEAMENSVSEHNKYAERFASLSEAIIAMQTDLSWIKNSLDK